MKRYQRDRLRNCGFSTTDIEKIAAAWEVALKDLTDTLRFKNFTESQIGEISWSLFGADIDRSHRTEV